MYLKQSSGREKTSWVLTMNEASDQGLLQKQVRHCFCPAEWVNHRLSCYIGREGLSAGSCTHGHSESAQGGFLGADNLEPDFVGKVGIF